MSTHNSHTNNHNSHNHKQNGHAAPQDAAPPDPKMLLKQAARGLVTSEPLSDKQKKSLVPLAHYPDAMLTLIADAYDEHADVLGASFDSAGVRAAIAFEQQQRPVAIQSRALADRLDEQILVKKAQAGGACTALYQAMKGVSRLPKGGVLRPVVKQIAAMLRTGPQKPRKPKVTPPAAPAAGAPPAAPGGGTP